MRLEAKTRKNLNRYFGNFTCNKYFDTIPFNAIREALGAFGLVPLQEDKTEFEGFFTGDRGDVFFEVAPKDSMDKYSGQHIPFDNTGLKMTWYKMESGRYEIVAYLS